MADKVDTAQTLLQILIAIGAFKGIEIFIKYLINRKKEKTNNIDDLYKKYSESCDTYMEQTAVMQKTITELRSSSVEMEARLIEMDKKLDEKNQIIVSLRQEVHSLNDETQKLKDAVSDLIKSKEILDGLKCEREDCESRIPAKNKSKIKRATA